MKNYCQGAKFVKKARYSRLGLLDGFLLSGFLHGCLLINLLRVFDLFSLTNRNTYNISLEDFIFYFYELHEQLTLLARSGKMDGLKCIRSNSHFDAHDDVHHLGLNIPFFVFSFTPDQESLFSKKKSNFLEKSK
jgi:hypothetical protein